MTTKEYSGAFGSWLSMMRRCFDPLDAAYANYGGRGITVCARWLLFAAFIEDMGGRPAGLSLDRVENDKGYSPDNCRWATSLTQSLNRRTARRHFHNGEAINQSLLSRELGIPESTLYRRALAGKPLGERRISAKLSRDKALQIRASADPAKIIAERYGVSHQTVYSIRLRRTWPE